MEKASLVSGIKCYVLNIKDWVVQNRLEAFFLFSILLIGAFLRLYKIDQYMTFLGDEGRDAIVVRRLLVNFDPILIGPGTSVGNMYLGPLYYYMMAPALFLANYSPVGPAIMVSILGVATIFLVWFALREWFPATTFKGGTLQAEYSINLPALIGATLYAISPTVIAQSRSSWNPYIIPFFSLLCIYSIWKVWSASAEASARQAKWLVILGISYAFVLQSHYLGLILAPVIVLFWFLSFKSAISKQSSVSSLARYSLISLLIFAVLMSPLVIFDARHEWRNFSAIRNFFSQSENAVSISPLSSISKVYPIFKQINTRLIAGRNETAGTITTWVVLGLSAWLLFIKREKYDGKKLSGYFLLAMWFGVGLIGLGFYKQEIYDHYFGFLFPAPFLLVGALTNEVLSLPAGKAGIKYKVLSIFFMFVVLSLLVLNLLENPIKNAPNRQMQRAQTVAQKIIKESGGERFNLAVIAERNYEDGYQYFLEVWGAEVIDIDAQRPETVANQLFAVCEMPAKKCDPTHNPKAEIANFGWSKIESEWEVSGVILYKLGHADL